MIKVLDTKFLTQQVIPFAFLFLFIAIYLFPSVFIPGRSVTEIGRDFGLELGKVESSTVILCDGGLVCGVHFFLLKGAYGQTLISRQVVIDVRGFQNGYLVKQKNSDKKRTLQSVIEHELYHVDQISRLGAFKFFFMKAWIKEGLAEVASSNHTVTNISVEKICGNFNSLDSSEKYAGYRYLIEYLTRESSEVDIIKRNRKLNDMLKEYCANN